MKEARFLDHVLSVKQLNGGYSRKRPILHDVSFKMKAGELVGLVGLNGAGKSTTIKHILGLLDPFSGEIRINGHTIREDKTAYRKSMAYVPELPELYEQMTLEEHLQLSAMAYHLPQDEYAERSSALLKLFHMEKKKHWFPIHFSKGMRQKVMIMCAFLVRPDLYIVDEPFVGLDPLGIQSLLDLMTDMKKSGAAILMSTHILTTAEQYCDRFIILHDGRIAVQGTLDQIRRQFGDVNANLHEIYLAVARGETQWMQ
ncbi:ABC transporter ATP-binding protein [Sporolactobacillus inulinus]|jgi:ABC-2 type transport system ATP-binding protein|uniref:ABC transporter, ATP-binding protein EcsA n=2 Tax=Sporolactobacillus inulinus TaxID=2078 RepID=A0A4Y1ZFW5_9BACL|nr:ABC transporter ATP-binding protein [Sporolactobacillus inulinus]KLI02465.1 multidrug ABC transporter ATP-binding protein [Sporolactobacillus inulinus CASD]GAY77378.1 ABC transporter, ATP-binding protein EcsA [Sporolactobacillus inulinus]GEB75794.1 ABC transporter ATP-binding protein [Sporolactobacillus inulinus]